MYVRIVQAQYTKSLARRNSVSTDFCRDDPIALRQKKAFACTEFRVPCTPNTLASKRPNPQSIMKSNISLNRGCSPYPRMNDTSSSQQKMELRREPKPFKASSSPP